MSYVGLDIGTTSVRAIAFEVDGTILATSSRDLTTMHPGQGRVEQDPNEIATHSIEVLHDLAGALDETPRSIGIANQRETVVAWENQTLKPLAMAISWQDRRGASLCEELILAGNEDLIRRTTGLTLEPYFSATKYAHLVSELGISSRNGIQLGTVDSWLLANLTSNEQSLTDLTNASRTSLLNISSNEYDEQLGDLFGVPLDLLPIPLPSNAMFGEITHPSLQPWLGVPIHAVLGDQQASLFGQGCTAIGDTKATMGTGTFLLTNSGTKRLGPQTGLITSIAWNLSGAENTFCLEGSIFTTASLLDWLIEVIGIASNNESLQELARSVRTSEQVTILPFFLGTGSPWWSKDTPAVLAGLDSSSSKGQIARAAFESIALQIAKISEEIGHQLGSQISSLKLDGGLSNLDFLCQLIADQTNLDCHASDLAESTAFGAAMMSAVGMGDIQPESLRTSYSARKTFDPSANRISAKSREKRWNAYLNKLGLNAK
ncbi:MAG: FGGY family carbohydrate kinase [Actinomycetota bacterium]|nr:FGGY family carbohydrate kinase [Actinomycetota bacterium]